jgi:hypothetical protein
MWPPVAKEDITIEMILHAWKDRMLINKALKEINLDDSDSDIDLDLDIN